MLAAFRAGELDRDVVVVVATRVPSPTACPSCTRSPRRSGCSRTAGSTSRWSRTAGCAGASGAIPAAIHVTPECATGGPLASLRDGDVIRVDGNAGTLEAKVEPGELAAREPHVVDLAPHHAGLGRELFAVMRSQSAGAEEGAASFGWPGASAPTVVLEPAAP